MIRQIRIVLRFVGVFSIWSAVILLLMVYLETEGCVGVKTPECDAAFKLGEELLKHMVVSAYTAFACSVLDQCFLKRLEGLLKLREERRKQRRERAERMDEAYAKERKQILREYMDRVRNEFILHRFYEPIVFKLGRSVPFDDLWMSGDDIDNETAAAAEEAGLVVDRMGRTLQLAESVKDCV